MYKALKSKSNSDAGKDDEKYILQEFNFYKKFWLFIIFSFMGFIIETIWCFLRYGEIQSRQGLIYGPFSQVYGFGGLVLIVILNQIKSKKKTIVFIYSIIIGGIFEYVCSFIQEFLLGSVSWQYNSTVYILNGRTSIIYSIFWGVLGTALIFYLYPLCSKIVDKILCKIGIKLTLVFVAFMLLDFFISGAAVYRENQRINNIPAKNAIQRFLDRNYPDSYLERIYPNMIFKQ